MRSHYMCGIFAYVGANVNTKDANAIKHRGPDNTKSLMFDKVSLVFHRLMINDLTPLGDQPFNLNGAYLICNGEIYNHLELENKYGFRTKSHSDCEVILHLYHKIGIHRTLQELSGYFAFVIYDKNKEEVIVARDPIGVRSLYFGVREELETHTNEYVIASEMKAIPSSYNISQFPPGMWSEIDLKTQTKKITRYYDYKYHRLQSSESEIKQEIRRLFEEAVFKRFMTDRPFGVFLSGGFDSSIVAALVARHSKNPIHTFSIGLKESTDLRFARMVADHIHSIHHEIIVDEKTMLDAIPDVIRSIESYDTTTVRASTPMWLMSQWISKNMPEIVVVFSGEGSDELSGSYLYFHNAPSAEAFYEETVRLITDLHYFDCLRCDKSTAAHGLEVRVPFLDTEFVKYYMSVPPEMKMCSKDKMEKFLLRSCFDDGLLPNAVLWRKKEAFSDGVSGERSWFQIIQEYVNTQVTDEEFMEKKRPNKKLKESYYYRKIYDQYYSDTIPYYWLPKWSGDMIDPSARLLTLDLREGLSRRLRPKD